MTLATDKTKVSSYMDGELVRQIRVLAAMEGHSVSSYLESLAKREVEQARKKGVRFDLLKSSKEDSSTNPYATPPTIEQRRQQIGEDNPTNPYVPPRSIEQRRQQIGDDNPTNPYTPPTSRKRGGKQ